MTKKTKNSETVGEKKPNTRPQAFTPMNARQAQEASVRSRNLRKQVRAQILHTIVTELDLGQELKKAILSGDPDRVNLLQTAFKMIGLHQDQSEEGKAKPTISATAETKTSNDGQPNDNAANQTLKLQFEIVDPEPDEDEEA